MMLFALLCLSLSILLVTADALSSSPKVGSLEKATSWEASTKQAWEQRHHQQQQPIGNILILDHLNINHEKGRHDWLKAFYFDFLQCIPDPRKADNLKAGTKTVWANIGANQFHLPEGKPDAQVLDGVVTLTYPSLSKVSQRYDQVKDSLLGSCFSMREMENALLLTDPWGSKFCIVQGDAKNERDPRGQQDGGASEGHALRDLTIYTPKDTELDGIGRFYQQILGAPILECSSEKCVVSVGFGQTLTFVPHPNGLEQVSHVNLRDDGVETPEGFPTFLSNYGPHISMYVANLPDCYRKAEELQLAYVNPRFKRRAYTLDEALDDCMFRCLDIVDPTKPEAGPILRLEHEIRSVVKRDGSMYKSCPFDKIPSS